MFSVPFKEIKRWREFDNGGAVNNVARVLGSILTMDYCLCGAPYVLHVSVWVYYGFSGFHSLSRNMSCAPNDTLFPYTMHYVLYCLVYEF